MFTVTQSKVVGSTFIVEGTDVTGKSGTAKLTSPAWEAVLIERNHRAATEAFDEASTEFFKPLSDAIDAARKIAHPSTNQWSKYVFEAGTEFEPQVELDLDEHGTYLRMLEETDGSMFRWIGDELFV